MKKKVTELRLGDRIQSSYGFSAGSSVFVVQGIVKVPKQEGLYFVIMVKEDELHHGLNEDSEVTTDVSRGATRYVMAEDEDGSY